MLKMFPSLWTDRLMVPDSCSSSFRKSPTCSECTTSQNTHTSARSLWMLALHIGSRALRTDRLTDRHTWQGGGPAGEGDEDRELEGQTILHAPKSNSLNVDILFFFWTRQPQISFNSNSSQSFRPYISDLSQLGGGHTSHVHISFTDIYYTYLSYCTQTFDAAVCKSILFCSLFSYFISIF